MTLRASIDVGEPVRTGEPFPVAVVVETTRARQTRGISLLLRGFTTLRHPTHNPQDPETFGTWRVALSETAALARGTHRFEGSLLLPEDAPPDGEGMMEVYYQLDARVKVELPWLFDATATRRLVVVRPPRRDRPPPRPVKTSNEANGRNGLFVELSLDDASFAPGEAITGAFSLGNIDGRRVDAATVSLVPVREDVIGGSVEASVFKSLVGAEEGSVVRFSLPLPPRAALSFPSSVLDVEQAILLHVDGSHVDCRIPIVIDTFEPRAGEPPAAPLVGQTRWRFAWRDEGKRAGLSLEGRELGLHGTLAGEIEAKVRPRGNGVIARLQWESLGVGLSIEPHTILSRGVPLDELDPAFAKRFNAHGNDPAQVVALLSPDLRAAISAFEDIELDDTGAKIASSASARNADELRRFLAALEALADAVVAAGRRLRGEKRRGPYR